MMARQLATMIGAGMPLIRALNILTSQTENKRLAQAIADIGGDIERGSRSTRRSSVRATSFRRSSNR